MLVNDVNRCEWYQQQSQNVLDKGHCEPSSKNPTLEEKKEAWKYNNQTQWYMRATNQMHVIKTNNVVRFVQRQDEQRLGHRWSLESQSARLLAS